MPMTPDELLNVGKPAEKPRTLPPPPQKRHFIIAGLLSAEKHQMSYEAAQYLASSRPSEFEVTALQQLPFQWREWRRDQADIHPVGKKLLTTDTCIVLEEGTEHAWIDDEFVTFVKSFSDFKLFHFEKDDPDSYAASAKRRYHELLRQTGDCFCWLDVKVGEKADVKRMVFQLFAKKCPMTVENFRHLCKGDLPPKTDPTTQQKVKLHYKGTTIFRVVKDGWVQGGDISSQGTMKAGSGGISVFDDKNAAVPGAFPDECFEVSHIDEGILGMANVGPHTNGSQFYITCARNQWMDGKYVAFGRVIDGIASVREMHAVETKPNQAPTIPIVVQDCGELSIDA